jgi:hypothetical protein
MQANLIAISGRVDVFVPINHGGQTQQINGVTNKY